MALQIIDRRLAGKNKSVGNRERFLRRYKEQISEAVKRAVSGRDIRNIEQAEPLPLGAAVVMQGGVPHLVQPRQAVQPAGAGKVYGTH